MWHKKKEWLDVHPETFFAFVLRKIIIIIIIIDAPYLKSYSF